MMLVFVKTSIILYFYLTTTQPQPNISFVGLDMKMTFHTTHINSMSRKGHQGKAKARSRQSQRKVKARSKKGQRKVKERSK